MDNIWTLMTVIAYGFEFVGFVLIGLWAMTMIFETGNERVDKIRKYMLMQDEEDLN